MQLNPYYIGSFIANVVVVFFFNLNVINFSFKYCFYFPIKKISASTSGIEIGPEKNLFFWMTKITHMHTKTDIDINRLE